MALPGFGPYTARSVSSLAFGEPVGVVDGNVIRVLSRLFNSSEKWWLSSGKSFFQRKADACVQGVCSAKMNQALMELGALLCTPKNPQCFLCPLHSTCQSYREKNSSSKTYTET